MRKLIIIALIATTGSACSPGLKSNGESRAPQSETGLRNDPPAPVGPPAPENQARWGQVSQSMKGEADGGAYSGTPMIEVDINRRAIVLIMPMPSLFMVQFSSMPLSPSLPGATLEMRTLSNGTTALAAVIPLNLLIKGVTLGNYGRLPNGEPIPGIPAGEARGIAVQFPQNPKYRFHVYLTVNAAAVFIETPDWKFPKEFELIPTISFPIRNAESTQILGYFAVVPNRGAFSSGVYVSSRIPRQVAGVIDELLRLP